MFEYSDSFPLAFQQDHNSLFRDGHDVWWNKMPLPKSLFAIYIIRLGFVWALHFFLQLGVSNDSKFLLYPFFVIIFDSLLPPNSSQTEVQPAAISVLLHCTQDLTLPCSAWKLGELFSNIRVKCLFFFSYKLPSKLGTFTPICCILPFHSGESKEPVVARIREMLFPS